MSSQSFDELRSLGDHFYKAEKWHQAVKAYNEAVEQDPNWDFDATFQFNLGVALLKLDRIDEAQSAFSECVSIDDENSAAWLNLGTCEERNQDWQEAKTSFELATTYSPGLVEGWKGLARCAKKTGDDEVHREALERIVRLEPGGTYWLNELGNFYLNLGDSANLKKALQSYLHAAKLGGDACFPNNAAISYRKLKKWLDAADAYGEALRRDPNYASSLRGIQEIATRLANNTAEIRKFSESLPPCKHPYERYLNPYEILGVQGALSEIPEGDVFKKLKQRAIQLVQLNDGHADWLDSSEIGESRIRQVLDELDDQSGKKKCWHWVIYKNPSLNRFLSHGDPSFFALEMDGDEALSLSSTPYWEVRNENVGAADFFNFIHPYFLASFEPLLSKALESENPRVVQALCSGRIPEVDTYDYFRRANKWLESKAEEIKRFTEALKKPHGIEWWSTTPKPMDWFPHELANSLPEECQAGRTELARSVRALGLELHNEHELTSQALEVTDAALKLETTPTLIDHLKRDREALVKILQESAIRKKEEESWNLSLQIKSDQIEINKERVRCNTTVIPAEAVSGVRFGVFKQYTNGICTNCSYSIGICSASTFIEIECKRAFRSETQAQEDFTKILQSLAHQIFPTLIMGLVEKIYSGGMNLDMGPLQFTKWGIRCETGSLWWKKEHIVEYSNAVFSSNQGASIMRSNIDPSIFFQIDRKRVWNAVIAEQLVKILVLRQAANGH
jgi:tetratricopeptide (TPR) repeat protein